MKFLFAGLVAGVVALASTARADIIPYGDSGTYNAATYTFTAASTGDLIAYFIGGGQAGYDNDLGVLVNGVAQGGFGLNNHASNVGDSYNFGAVQAGDILTFILRNNSLSQNAYSDPSLNGSYDQGVGTNHVYSTAYTATSPLFAGVPVGVYVGFEDLPFGGSDFNYNDESFVFANTVVAGGVPEPSTWAMMLLGLGGLGFAAARRRSALVPAKALA